MIFEKEIIRMIKKETGIKEVSLEVPSHADYGDFAFPAFQLAKVEKKNPMEIALDLSEKLKPNELIEKIVPKGPYVNFFVNRQYLAELTLRSVMRMQKNYGSSFSGKDQSVLIEHTSINPNAEPHVGRARNAIIADSIVRILRFQGYTVEVHYFVNDIGKQIAMLVYGAGSKTPTFKGLLALYTQANAKVKSNPKVEQEIFKLLNELESGNKEVRRKFKNIVEICVTGQKKILGELGIKYDKFDYESEYLWNNATKEVLKRLEKTGKVFTDPDGRKVLDLEGFELPMKSPVFVLTRNDGTSLYGLRDIAYNLEKTKIGKDRNILILGEEQRLYAKQIEASLSLLKVKSPEVVHYSFITLPGGGKMSTREGTVVMLTDFMAESIKRAKDELKAREAKPNEKLAKAIGLGAVKYAILKVSPEKNIAFEWEKALSFDGETAPYIQYSHARASSILKKAKKIDIEKANYKLIKTPEEAALILKLYQFPEVIQKATDSLRPHLIAVYAYALAKSFNDFYHTCPVLSNDEELSKARIVIVASAKQVLETSLNLLGIDAPKKM